MRQANSLVRRLSCLMQCSCLLAIYCTLQLNAQTTQLAPASRLIPIISQPPSTLPSAPSVDPAGFRKPIEIGTTGLIHGGDDPAYADPAFDDSQWKAVNKKSRLRDYFPETYPIVWRRLHVRVNPADTGLAISIEPYGIDRAFEIYVNGRQLLTSGQVEPYIPYTRTARLIVPIPDDQTHTGTLLIAVRQRAPFATWNRVNAAFSSKSLSIGPEQKCAIVCFFA